jgi:very-short-patch-repair endonuclease
MPRPRKRGKYKGKRIPWKIIRKHNRKRQPSSLERKVYDWLDEDKIKFTREKPIGRHLHVDIFLEPNICIELNGCHWHGCLICNKDLSKDQKVAQQKDARRYHTIRRIGHDVVVFWECEVNEYPDRVRQQLRALAGRK